MTKAPILADITSQYGLQSAYNDNNDNIQAAFENTVSLDGSTPNTMAADFDMGGNDIVNVKDVEMSGNLVIDGVNFVPTSATTVPDWEGAWVTATAYVANDLVQESGNAYICLVAHTSGTFSADLAANKWELFAAKGSAGAGTGDMLASNNLSDVSDAPTSRTNLGVAIGNDVQAQVLYTFGVTSGSGSAFTATCSPTLTAYSTGQLFVGRLHTATSASGTIDVDGVGAKSLKYYTQVGTKTDVPNGGVQANTTVTLYYDGTDMVILAGMNTIPDVSSGYVKLFDEDDMASDSNSHGATQQSIKAYVDSLSMGVDQTWQDVTGSRTGGVSYQNTTGRPIHVVVSALPSGTTRSLQVSADGVSWVNVGYFATSVRMTQSAVVPNSGYYRVSSGSAGVVFWSELR